MCPLYPTQVLVFLKEDIKTCGRCSVNFVAKDLVIIPQHCYPKSALHLNCWQPGKLVPAEELNGFSKLSDAVEKPLVRKVLKQWQAKYDEEDKQILRENKQIMFQRKRKEMALLINEKTSQAVEGFLEFCRISPQLVQLIAGFVDGDDVKILSCVSKHWQSVWNSEQIWQEMCKAFPAVASLTPDPHRNWRTPYHRFTSPCSKVEVSCANCGGQKASFSVIFSLVLCGSCMDHTDKYRIRCAKQFWNEKLTITPDTRHALRPFYCDSPREMFYSEEDLKRPAKPDVEHPAAVVEEKETKATAHVDKKAKTPSPAGTVRSFIDKVKARVVVV